MGASTEAVSTPEAADEGKMSHSWIFSTISEPSLKGAAWVRGWFVLEEGCWDDIVEFWHCT